MTLIMLRWGASCLLLCWCCAQPQWLTAPRRPEQATFVIAVFPISRPWSPWQPGEPGHGSGSSDKLLSCHNRNNSALPVYSCSSKWLSPVPISPPGVITIHDVLTILSRSCGQPGDEDWGSHTAEPGVMLSGAIRQNTSSVFAVDNILNNTVYNTK